MLLRDPSGPVPLFSHTIQYAAGLRSEVHAIARIMPSASANGKRYYVYVVGSGPKQRARALCLSSQPTADSTHIITRPGLAAAVLKVMERTRAWFKTMSYCFYSWFIILAF